MARVKKTKQKKQHNIYTHLKKKKFALLELGTAVSTEVVMATAIGGGKGGTRGLKPPPPQNDTTPKLSFLEWG